MERRQFMGAGIVGTSLIASSRRWESRYRQSNSRDAEQIISDSYREPGLATGLSNSGETVLFGFDNGNVMIFDDTRNGVEIPFSIDRSVSHIEVRENADTAVIGWMDADVFGFLDLTAEDGPAVEHPGLWDISTTANTDAVASVSYPDDGPGSVVLSDSEGTVQWETALGDAIGHSVSITDDGTYIAVGTAQYFEGEGSVGESGIRLYDGSGNELWRHNHDEDVLSVGIDAERELVIGGTNDNLTIALDFDGQVLWETDEFGGWITLSDDGGAVVSSEPGRMVAVDSETGEERWSGDADLWAAGDLSVSTDGSRVFAAERGGADFTVIDEGETIWSDSHNVGPGLGALSGDGDTWSIIVTDLDEETALVEGYQIPEPEPDITVVDAELNTTNVEINEAIEIEVTLENAGDAEGSGKVELRVDDEVVDSSNIEIAAGASETFTFSQTFEERGKFEIKVGEIDVGIVEVIDPNVQTVVDFDWSYPDCPSKEVGELERYFLGNLGDDGFHLDDGKSASDEPDSCVLRTDADEAAIFSSPGGHEDQPDTLEHYPRRGETILFEHYVHRSGANMEFRFGVQEDLESYYAVRLETEEEPSRLNLLRVDDGSVTELDQVTELSYTDGQFHHFEVEWLADEFIINLVQEDQTTTLSATDDTYGEGGIGFYKENAGIVRSYAHLWNTIEVRQ